MEFKIVEMQFSNCTKKYAIKHPDGTYLTELAGLGYYTRKHFNSLDEAKLFLNEYIQMYMLSNPKENEVYVVKL